MDGASHNTPGGVSVSLPADNAGHAERATQTIAGELIARSYLNRMHEGVAQPGELSTMLCYLRGELLHGACRVIEKALEGCHHE